jgi:hypothetical protein
LPGSCGRGRCRRGTTARAQAGGRAATASQPLLRRPGPPLVADERQHRIDARPSGHGPPHGRGALYASAGGGLLPSAFCTRRISGSWRSTCMRKLESRALPQTTMGRGNTQTSGRWTWCRR